MIVVVRHGRTVSNAAGLLLGRADPDLDELGIDQARRLGAALGHEAGPAVDRIVTSPLARTRQTAAAVAAATGAAVTVDERFVELDYGEWDQRPLADVAADEWAAWRADVAFAPPGGESLAELGRRVRSGLDDLAEEARDDEAEREHAGLAEGRLDALTDARPWFVGGGFCLRRLGGGIHARNEEMTAGVGRQQCGSARPRISFCMLPPDKARVGTCTEAAPRTSKRCTSACANARAAALRMSPRRENAGSA